MSAVDFKGEFAKGTSQVF
jgi:hypothetical protein